VSVRRLFTMVMVPPVYLRGVEAEALPALRRRGLQIGAVAAADRVGNVIVCDHDEMRAVGGAEAAVAGIFQKCAFLSRPREQGWRIA
jgi:hypothetical protein